jgi:hypothetical protein
MSVESGYTLELRNCTCDTTLATVIRPIPAHLVGELS